MLTQITFFLNKKKLKELPSNQKGQVFIEFLLLFLIFMILSFSMLKGFNQNIAGRWESMIKIIAAPTRSNIKIP